MEQLNFVRTKDTPAITFDNPKGLFKISGRSTPADVRTFYKPVFEWLELFSIKPTDKLKLEIDLEYFNTPSSKIILDILVKLEEIHKGGACAIDVNWLYDQCDDNMREVGEEYKELVEVPFILIPN